MFGFDIVSVDFINKIQPDRDEDNRVNPENVNNPDARRYTADGTEKVESITADEFRDIYADFGYVAADSRDPASLSYLYKIDSANWLLLLDSCQ